MRELQHVGEHGAPLRRWRLCPHAEETKSSHIENGVRETERRLNNQRRKAVREDVNKHLTHRPGTRHARRGDVIAVNFHQHGGEAPEAAAGGSGSPLRWRTLLVLAVATSIDALAVGLTFAMTGTPILRPAVIIGLTCAAISAAGLHLGRVLAGMAALQRWAGLIGGLVLLAIGLRVLWQDGVFG